MRALAPLLCSLPLVLAACATTPADPIAALRPFYANYDAPRPQRPQGAEALATHAVITRLAFGSCMEETKAAPILNAVAASQADAFVLMGDNVYGDADSGDMTLPELRQAYADLAAHDDFARVNAAMPIWPLWDDHDYGMNDAGGNFSAKEYAEALFLDFWRIPAADPRRARPGVYAAEAYGPEGRTVRLVFVDTRFFRDPLTPGTEGRRYDPNDDPTVTMLGANQWAWLEAELAKPADLTVVVSSIQVIADGHGWEAWRTMPAERERLYALIRDAAPANVVLVSGDRHRAGLYRRDLGAGRVVHELTSSSLNLPVSAWGGEEEPGPNRLGPTYLDENFGLLDIDWDARTATLSVRDGEGASVLSETITLQ